MSQVAVSPEPAPWPMSLFSPRTSPSQAPAQPAPGAGSPSAQRLSPGGFSLVPEPPFLGSPGGARGAPKGTGISVVPIPARSRSQTLPPPGIAPSSPQTALLSSALPSPAPEELSEGYDADEGGRGGMAGEEKGETQREGKESAEERDTADKAGVPHTQKDAGRGAEPGSGSGARAEAGADGGGGKGAEPGAAEGDAGGSDRGATGGVAGAEGGRAHVGAGSGSEQAEAGDLGGEAVGLEAAPGVGGGDAAEVVASRPLGHLRCANVDEAEVAAISHLLLMALAEAVVEKRKGDMFPRPLETLAESARKELCAFLDSHGTGAGAGAGAGGTKGAAHKTPGGTPSGTPEVSASGVPGTTVVPGAPFALPAPSLALASEPPGQGNMQEPVQGAKHAAGEGEGEGEASGAALGSPQPDTLIRSSSSSTGEAARPNGSGAPTGLSEPSKGAGDQAVLSLAGPESAGGPQQKATWELNGGDMDAAVRQTLASSPPQPQPPTCVPNGVHSGVPITVPSQGASASPLGTGAGGMEQWKEGEWVPPPLQVAPQVEKLLEEFVASQLTLLTRLSSAFGATNRAAVEGAAGELEAAKLWEGEMRRDLARVLIQRMDVNFQGHCGREFLGEQDLRGHELGCPYKAVACPHAPCQVSLSQRHMGPHQELCPHRLLPCRQGCAEAVPRGVMGAHCGSTCPMRVLPCPFAALPGCACGPLLQRDLPAHLGREAQAHQLLMLQAVVANQELGRALSQRLGLLEKAQELQEKAMSLELRGVHVKLAEVGGRVDKVQGRVDKVERGLAKGSQDWRQQQGALKRETEALKQQVQGLLK